jgi:hypothetical protein
MGFLDNRRQKAEQDRTDRERGVVEQVYAAWYRTYEQLSNFVEEARTFDGHDGPDVQGCTMVLKRDERVFLVAAGAHLIEPRRAPGKYVGGYQGVSFKVMKGVRYHVGGTKGTYTQGEERPTPIDDGTVTITNQRVVFQGMKQAREWAFAKLIGMQHDPNLPWTAIQVSNRQKVSGFLYDETNAALVRFRLSLALAHFQGDVGDLERQVAGELQEHRDEQPAHPGADPKALTATTG